MSLLDLFKKSPEKKLKSLQKKVTERYGQAEVRQGAIEQLLAMGSPEALSTLLMRFTVASEPSITDREEKEHVCDAIVEMGPRAIEPLRAFLRSSELATSWTVKMLQGVLPKSEVTSELLGALNALGNEYTRDPQKKLVLIDALGHIEDERIGPALVPFLEDPNDDVRIATATALARLKEPTAREPLLRCFAESLDRARVIATLADALCVGAYGVQGFRETVEGALPPGYYVDRAGLVHKRG